MGNTKTPEHGQPRRCRRYLLGLLRGFQVGWQGKGYGYASWTYNVPFNATRRGWKVGRALRHPIRHIRLTLAMRHVQKVLNSCPNVQQDSSALLKQCPESQGLKHALFNERYGRVGPMKATELGLRVHASLAMNSKTSALLEKEEEAGSSPNVPIGRCSGCGCPVYTQAGFCGGCHPHFS